MYVIATVICPNFHFSVSPHVPFLNLLFEQIANSNEYLLAKIGVDTAENEPLEVWGNIIQYYSFVSLEVAELKNGSVILTSRNFYDRRSGFGPRMFARSDDGGETWVQRWSTNETEVPDTYCEGSILSDASAESGQDLLFYGHPSAHSRRNY